MTQLSSAQACSNCASQRGDGGPRPLLAFCLVFIVEVFLARASFRASGKFDIRSAIASSPLLRGLIGKGRKLGLSVDRWRLRLLVSRR